jgi:hypothetical protein
MLQAYKPDPPKYVLLISKFEKDIQNPLFRAVRIQTEYRVGPHSTFS